MSSKLPLVALGLIAIVWAFQRWRPAFQAVMVLLVLEGAIRKWLLPGAQDLVYFAKDALLVGIYAGWWLSPLRGLRPRVPPLLSGALTLLVAFGTFQVFNPALPNVLVGVLGFKSYFLYLPLIWVMPSAFRDDRELAAFLKRYVLLAIPVGLLAMAQFFSPADSALNTYARGAGASAMTFGSSAQVRVTGTFSYITGYSSYVLTISILILSLLAATRWRLRGNLLVYAALGLTVLGMLMTGSRGAALTLALLFPLYYLLGVAREGGAGSTLGRLLLGVGVLGMLLNYVGSDAVGAFYGRASAGSDVRERITAPIVQPFNKLGDAGLLGFGIGATHQAAQSLANTPIPYSWMRGVVVEDEPGRIMLELGPIGFLLAYFLRVYLVIVSLARVFSFRTPFHRAIATCCALFFLAHLPGGVVFNVTAGLYYGFFAGLLFVVDRLDREGAPVARASARAPAAAPLRVVPKTPRATGVVPSP